MYPDFEQVQRIASTGKYRRVPVCRELYADSFTPVEVMRILRQKSRHCYLLESAEDNQKWGRYSFLGYDPVLELSCTDGELRIRRIARDDERPDEAGGGQPAHERQPVIEACVRHPGEAVRRVLAEYRSPVMEKMPPFTGGLVGYFSYDYLKYAEPALQGREPEARDFKDVDLMLFDKVIVFDHYRQKLLLITGVSVPCDGRQALSRREDPTEEACEKTLEQEAMEEDNAEEACETILEREDCEEDHKKKIRETVNQGLGVEGLREAYQAALKELQDMADLLMNGRKARIQPLKLHEKLTPRFTEKQYCEMVEKARHYIREGDIFQVVLSNPVTAAAEGSLFDTYRELRTTNPSPYMFYFSSDDIEIAGASPETLVKLKDGILHTFPLAGTRSRGATEEEDRRLERELLQDDKELAEHNMLVDLGRNDLGRISRLGSVKVEKYMSVQRFSHVMHLGSTVSGMIREDRDAVDAVDAILPAGTLSGAPKIRACEIIRELEGCRRGIYGGAVGYLDFTGNLDTCIAIRLAYKKDGRVCVQSGAGIVADSVPEKEYQECLNKARAVMNALYASEGGLR